MTSFRNNCSQTPKDIIEALRTLACICNDQMIAVLNRAKLHSHCLPASARTQAGFDAEELDLLLKMQAHTLLAVIVAQSKPLATFWRMAPKQRRTAWRTEKRVCRHAEDLCRVVVDGEHYVDVAVLCGPRARQISAQRISGAGGMIVPS